MVIRRLDALAVAASALGRRRPAENQGPQQRDHYEGARADPRMAHRHAQRQRTMAALERALDRPMWDPLDPDTIAKFVQNLERVAGAPEDQRSGQRRKAALRGGAELGMRLGLVALQVLAKKPLASTAVPLETPPPNCFQVQQDPDFVDDLPFGARPLNRNECELLEALFGEAFNPHITHIQTGSSPVATAFVFPSLRAPHKVAMHSSALGGLSRDDYRLDVLAHEGAHVAFRSVRLPFTPLLTSTPAYHLPHPDLSPAEMLQHNEESLAEIAHLLVAQRKIAEEDAFIALAAALGPKARADLDAAIAEERLDRAQYRAWMLDELRADPTDEGLERLSRGGSWGITDWMHIARATHAGTPIAEAVDQQRAQVQTELDALRARRTEHVFGPSLHEENAWRFSSDRERHQAQPNPIDDTVAGEQLEAQQSALTAPAASLDDWATRARAHAEVDAAHEMTGRYLEGFARNRSYLEGFSPPRSDWALSSSPAVLHLLLVRQHPEFTKLDADAQDAVWQTAVQRARELHHAQGELLDEARRRHAAESDQVLAPLLREWAATPAAHLAFSRAEWLAGLPDEVHATVVEQAHFGAVDHGQGIGQSFLASAVHHPSEHVRRLETMRAFAGNERLWGAQGRFRPHQAEHIPESIRPWLSTKLGDGDTWTQAAVTALADQIAAGLGPWDRLVFETRAARDGLHILDHVPETTLALALTEAEFEALDPLPEMAATPEALWRLERELRQTHALRAEVLGALDLATGGLAEVVRFPPAPLVDFPPASPGDVPRIARALAAVDVRIADLEETTAEIRSALETHFVRRAPEAWASYRAMVRSDLPLEEWRFSESFRPFAESYRAFQIKLRDGDFQAPVAGLQDNRRQPKAPAPRPPGALPQPGGGPDPADAWAAHALDGIEPPPPGDALLLAQLRLEEIAERHGYAPSASPAHIRIRVGDLDVIDLELGSRLKVTTRPLPSEPEACLEFRSDTDLLNFIEGAPHRPAHIEGDTSALRTLAANIARRR